MCKHIMKHISFKSINKTIFYFKKPNIESNIKMNTD